MQIVHFPKIGLASEPATVRELLKIVGDQVQSGDALMVVETEKSTVDVQSSASGRIGRFLVDVDQSIPPGTALAVVLEVDELIDEVALAELVRSCAPGGAPDASADSIPQRPIESVAAPEPVSAAAVKAAPSAAPGRPANIDLSALCGTGPEGAITEADLAAYRDRSANDTMGPLSGAAAINAAKMARNWREVPHIHQITEVRADALIKARRLRGSSLTPLLIKAAALALRKYPAINAHFDGKQLMRLRSVDIAVAVGDEDSLITPVVTHADERSISEISDILKNLRERAQTHKLTSDDLAPGSFTISNLGMHQVDGGAAIINAPQVAIMFVGRVKRRAEFEVGVLAECQYMNVTLSYDHRVVNGVPAARFTQEVRDLLEHPEAWV